LQCELRPSNIVQRSNNFFNFGDRSPPCKAEKDNGRNRLQPGDPRRQLEQQRQELPVGESEQERPRQAQQQPRFPSPEHKLLPEGAVYGLHSRAQGIVQAVILRRHFKPDK